MKARTRADAFAPGIALIVETRIEYDAVMLALRIGADGIRKMAVAGEEVPTAAKLADQARQLMENPEVEK